MKPVKPSMSVKPSTSVKPSASVELSKPLPLVLSKRLQTSQASQGLRGFLVFLSIALHGGALLLPMPQWWLKSAEPEPESEPEKVIEQSGAIALTTLPVIAEPEAKIGPQEPAPLEPAPIPKVLEPPPPLIQVPDNLPEELIFEEPLEELENSEDVEQTFEPEALDKQNSEPEAGIAVQFSNDFPHLAGAQTGCYGLDNCRMAEGQNYIDALQEITENLEAQGYELTPYEGNDDSDVRNHRIYEMRLPEDSETDVKYLNVFGEGFKTAIYIITPRLITQAELQALSD